MTDRQDTDDLIRRLAAAPATAPLPRPSLRAFAWLLGAILWVGLVAFVLTPRDDLAAMLQDSRFLAEAAAALLTGIAAAIAAFSTVVPGHQRKVVALSGVVAGAWIAVVGVGCFQDWLTSGADGLRLQTDWSCFPSILMTGIVPAMAIAWMLRRGAPMTPMLSMLLGGLASAALADCGLRFHHREAGVMVLVWHLSAVAILLAVSARVGRKLLVWPV